MNEAVVIHIETPERSERVKVPYREGMTLLDALRWIKEHEIPDLEFEFSCRNAQCGTCAVLVNGKARLTCEYRLEPGQKVIVEPLRHLPVVKDLAVDWSAVTSRLRPLSPKSHREWFRRMEPEKQRKLYELRSCIECLCCVAECPVIKAGSARNPGPIVLRKVAEEAEKWDESPEIYDSVYACTTCHTCAEVCPKDIEIPAKAVETVRARLYEEGKGPLPEHKELGERAVRTGRSVEKRKRSFLEEYSGEYGEGDVKAMFFTGCLVDYRLPDTGKALVKLAEELGIRLIVPREQVCCGSPLLRTGQLDRAERLAFENLETFRRVDPDVIVTVCAGCGATLKNNYSELLGDRFEWDVLDVTELLVEIRAHERGFRLPERTTVTYHDPCHLKRGQGVEDEPRKLIRSIENVEFVEMEEPDRCCGAGGGVRSGLPELAELMSDVKAHMVRETGAEVLTTVCPFCEYNLREGLERNDVEARVENLTVLLSRGL
ncbi:fumarate reductase (CoM/CoB) subunit TfrB [Methanopyrus kandleri]